MEHSCTQRGVLISNFNQKCTNIYTIDNIESYYVYYYLCIHTPHTCPKHTQQTCTANAGMCVYTNLYVHTCKNAHTYVHAHLHMCTDRRTDVLPDIHIFAHVHAHVCSHVHPHRHAYPYMYACTPTYPTLYNTMCIKSSGSQIYVHTYTII